MEKTMREEIEEVIKAQNELERLLESVPKDHYLVKAYHNFLDKDMHLLNRVLVEIREETNAWNSLNKSRKMTKEETSN